MKNIIKDARGNTHEIYINHVHPLREEDMEAILLKMANVFNEASYVSDSNLIEETITVGNSYILSLIPREGLPIKRLFWAYRGNRATPSLCISKRFVPEEKIKRTNRIRLVYKVEEKNILLITAFPVANNNDDGRSKDEPSNYLRKSRYGRISYDEGIFSKICDFWANHVLIMEKGEIYSPAQAPKWYKTYWQKKYRPS